MKTRRQNRITSGSPQKHKAPNSEKTIEMAASWNTDDNNDNTTTGRNGNTTKLNKPYQLFDKVCPHRSRPYHPTLNHKPAMSSSEVKR